MKLLNQNSYCKEMKINSYAAFKDYLKIYGYFWKYEKQKTRKKVEVDISLINS